MRGLWFTHTHIYGEGDASLVAQMVKHLVAMWKTRVWSLGQEDPLEKEMGTHSSTLAWRIPWMEEPGTLQSMGSQRVRYNWVTSFSLSHTHTHTVDVVVQSASHVQFFVTPWTAAHQASLSLTISRSLLKFMFFTLVMPSSHLIFWCPLLLILSLFPIIRDFSNESSVCIRWPNYWSFSFSSSPSSEYSGLISIKIGWFDLLAVHRTFRSLLQHHISKVSNLCRSAFFMLQLSQPYMTTGKIIALTIQTFVSRVTYLLFTTLSSLVIAFLLRSNGLLISCMAAVTVHSDFGAQEEEVCHTSTFPPSICHALMGLDRGAWWATVHGVCSKELGNTEWLTHTHTHTHTQGSWTPWS